MSEVLFSCSFGLPVPFAVVPPLICALEDRCHAKLVFEKIDVGVYEKILPLQIAEGVSVLLKNGVGFTVTVIVSSLRQPFVLSVKTYLTSMGCVVILFRISLTDTWPVAPLL